MKNIPVPNPASGFLQMVKESDVVKTSMSVDDALKMIVSAGSTIPDSMKEQL